jgi:hypothetical protein
MRSQVHFAGGKVRICEVKAPRNREAVVAITPFQQRDTEGAIFTLCSFSATKSFGSSGRSVRSFMTAPLYGLSVAYNVKEVSYFSMPIVEKRKIGLPPLVFVSKVLKT